jgi:hypothetical protein
MNNFIILFLILIIIILGIFYHIYLNNNENNFDTNCINKRYGCCNDKITPKLDQEGTNCRGF